ncbi:hypothetical protein H1R20_g5845, partial [Candolleomyces eurysporus]
MAARIHRTLSLSLRSTPAAFTRHGLRRPATAAFRFMSSGPQQYENIIVSRPEPNVVLVQLNRPKALNALSSPLFKELNQALFEADQDDTVGAMVLTGSEKAFAAGADIKEMKDKTFADVYKNKFLENWGEIARLRKPVIAAVSGFALGGGCELALMCDIILASPTAKFGQPEINLGVIPGGGGSQRLAGIVGKSRAMELILTGRTISAREAENWGMVSRVVGEGEGQVVKDAVAMATEIASKSQVAVQAGKEVVNAAYELTLAEGLRFERRIFHGLFATNDQKEGNLCEIFQSQAGVPDFKYQELYGDVVRVHGLFGEHRLMISDPKALQYIIHTSGYAFPKWPERTEISRVLMGRGLLWADGDIHKRQRKVMLPGFGESKSFVPIFRRVAAELTAQWTDILASSRDQTAVLNVASWLSRATMDSIGEAAFDYHFGALQNTDNEFMHAYFGLMSDTLGSPPTSAIFMQTFMPLWYLQLMSHFSRRRSLVHARHTAKLANAVAKELVETKAEALLQGKGNKDILSLLVKANASENNETRLTEEEIYAQMRTILLAGHETSATTLCWVLLELARHPEVQQRLRKEIRDTERAIRARGGSDFTASDLDNMSYLHAVIKESMRYHPALYQNYRQAARDDVIPLSKPIIGRNGEVMNELPIAKGTKIILSIAAYNRNKEIFGEDAHEYKPERWLDNKEKKGPTLGVYGNLLTFAGGVRTCIGWRFALYEVLALTVEIINNFELGLTPDIERLRREACLVMLPTLEGEQVKGENLPLTITLAARE